MPFQSLAQSRKCFAGGMPGVDCQEWADLTDYKKIPKKKKPGVDSGQDQQRKEAQMQKQADPNFQLGRDYYTTRGAAGQIVPATAAQMSANMQGNPAIQGAVARHLIEGKPMAAPLQPPAGAKGQADFAALLNKVVPGLGTSYMGAGKYLADLVNAQPGKVDTSQMPAGQLRDFRAQQAGRAQELRAQMQAKVQQAAYKRKMDGLLGQDLNTYDPGVAANPDLSSPSVGAGDASSLVGSPKLAPKTPVRAAAPKKATPSPSQAQAAMAWLQDPKNRPYLMAGGLGIPAAMLGGYGLYRAMRPRKRRDDEREAALDKQAAAQELMDGYLDELAAKTQGEKRAVIRRIQAEFAASGNLPRAIEKGAACNHADAVVRSLELASAVATSWRRCVAT